MNTEPETVKSAYDAWSTTYDNIHNLTRDLDGQVIRSQLAELAVDSALEAGCGTGKNSGFLIGRAKRLTAADFSPGMLARARKKITSGRVDFLLADLTRPWPWRGRSFDLVTCNLILEHIANLPFIFFEARRTLRPGGHLFLCELHPFKQYQGLQAKFQIEGKTTPIPAFTHHISDFWQAANDQGFASKNFSEWWHDQDNRDQAPRLVSFLFQTWFLKPQSQPLEENHAPLIA